MATTSPARIDDDLYASAKLVGEVQSRSASQQVVHWARIGRELEASASVSHKDIDAALAGSRAYDTLTAKEQAVVRAEWASRMDSVRQSLDLADQFAAAGRSWAELDDDGNVVERSAPEAVSIAVAAKTAAKTAAKAAAKTAAKTVPKTTAVRARSPKARSSR
jgi:hypothetical protein